MKTGKVLSEFPTFEQSVKKRRVCSHQVVGIGNGLRIILVTREEIGK
jgi:hypothetical protein